MSSILDALKKAEQESGATGNRNAPWPALTAATSACRRSYRRWMMVTVVFVLVLASGVFWQLRRRSTPGPAVAVKTPTQPARRPAEAAQPAARPLADHAPPAEPKKTAPVKSPLDRPMDSQPPEEPGDVLKKEPPIMPPRQLLEKPPLPAKVGNQPPSLPVSSAAPRVDPQEPVPEAKTPSPDDNGDVRVDPRIDLQALVWAPEASERFVVINNRLIKEGGSIDDIVVLRINRDDVLLSTGTDRWRQVFQIR
ncbi:general secretion pathway protein GspB [Desulfosarcina ovata]|nr:general secretion pathway protein GspB [Desulfosarcina ovata]